MGLGRATGETVLVTLVIGNAIGAQFPREELIAIIGPDNKLQEFLILYADTEQTQTNIVKGKKEIPIISYPTTRMENHCQFFVEYGFFETKSFNS